ncbi:MAG TPA: metallophosphoesterase family protein [Xanthobacteraceae bacterium]|jgi:diadenosine tetraphosphatase ApaH/serine/threonine PP2A family protein phosphatase|nr:metallophosphoesterase family protein [Xanthobacteraceae bacterium]
MRIALFADIHGNRHAFAACLEQARELGAERVVLLGDYVGYGADPVWVISAVQELVARGALAVRGNHDSAVSHREHMNEAAQIAIDWTRGELGPAERRFLEELPFTHEEEDRLYVHADASRPEAWHYVLDESDAALSLSATTAAITLCGHVHQPMLYRLTPSGQLASFLPKTGRAVALPPDRRWLAVLGSVGQPRDRNPAASFATFDTDRRELTYWRANYDVEAAAAAIRSKGLPSWLADRLLIGA